MSKNQRLAKRLREVFIDGKWIANTNYQEQLMALDWQVATRSLGNANSIAMLSYHIHYYVAGILSAYQTGKLEIRDQYSFDMKPIHSKEDWEMFVFEFLKNANEFILLVESQEESWLEQAFFDEKYGSTERNIEGMIEHCYYHLGQISLLRKLISQA